LIIIAVFRGQSLAHVSIIPTHQKMTMNSGLRNLPSLYRQRCLLLRKASVPSYGRFFSSDDEKKDLTATKNALPLFIPPLVEASLRGVGQVIFLNSPTCGLVILGGLAVGNPYLSLLAALGASTATSTAHFAGMDKAAIKDGLLGYNGCLVGCAAAVFVSPLESASVMTAATMGMMTTVVGGAATPFVAAALKPALGSVPQFTLAFNLVTLSLLLRTRPLLPSPESSLEVNTATAANVSDVLMYAPWQGVSQIFVVESSLAGAAIVGGIAYYSRGLAAHTVLGSSIGAATGALMLGADMSSLAMGLYGFNSALTSLGVGVFFVHSPQVMALSAGGAIATAAVFGAMSTVFGAYGSPCLTLPFCLTMSGCYLLADTMPGLQLAKSPHSPEQNE
jgi:urea transporter